MGGVRKKSQETQHKEAKTHLVSLTRRKVSKLKSSRGFRGEKWPPKEFGLECWRRMGRAARKRRRGGRGKRTCGQRREKPGDFCTKHGVSMGRRGRGKEKTETHAGDEKDVFAGVESIRGAKSARRERSGKPSISQINADSSEEQNL